MEHGTTYQKWTKKQSLTLVRSLSIMRRGTRDKETIQNLAATQPAGPMSPMMTKAIGSPMMSMFRRVKHARAILTKLVSGKSTASFIDDLPVLLDKEIAFIRKKLRKCVPVKSLQQLQSALSLVGLTGPIDELSAHCRAIRCDPHEEAMPMEKVFLIVRCYKHTHQQLCRMTEREREALEAFVALGGSFDKSGHVSLAHLCEAFPLFELGVDSVQYNFNQLSKEERGVDFETFINLFDTIKSDRTSVYDGTGGNAGLTRTNARQNVRQPTSGSLSVEARVPTLQRSESVRKQTGPPRMSLSEFSPRLFSTVTVLSPRRRCSTPRTVSSEEESAGMGIALDSEDESLTDVFEEKSRKLATACQSLEEKLRVNKSKFMAKSHVDTHIICHDGTPAMRQAPKKAHPGPPAFYCNYEARRQQVLENVLERQQQLSSEKKKRASSASSFGGSKEAPSRLSFSSKTALTIPRVSPIPFNLSSVSCLNQKVHVAGGEKPFDCADDFVRHIYAKKKPCLTRMPEYSSSTTVSSRSPRDFDLVIYSDYALPQAIRVRASTLTTLMFQLQSEVRGLPPGSVIIGIAVKWNPTDKGFRRFEKPLENLPSTCTIRILVQE